MNGDEHRNRETESAREYLRKIESLYDVHIFGRIEKETSFDAKKQVDNHASVHIDNRPVEVRTMPDWYIRIISFIGVLISIGTLLLLFLTVYFAAQQWKEMRKANGLTLSVVKATSAAVVMPGIGFASKGNTVNVGFVNYGKTRTTVVSGFDISIVGLPKQNVLRHFLSEKVSDPIQPQGYPQMPNHYYEMGARFTPQDMDMFKISKEGIRVNGSYRYDDGFGDMITESFCKVAVNFQVMDCDAVRQYMLSNSQP